MIGVYRLPYILNPSKIPRCYSFERNTSYLLHGSFIFGGVVLKRFLVRHCGFTRNMWLQLEPKAFKILLTGKSSRRGRDVIQKYMSYSSSWNSSACVRLQICYSECGQDSFLVPQPSPTSQLLCSYWARQQSMNTKNSLSNVNPKFFKTNEALRCLTVS